MKVSICFFALMVAYTISASPNYLNDIASNDGNDNIDLDELKDIMSDKTKRHDLHEYLREMKNNYEGGDGEGGVKKLASIADSKASYHEESENLIKSLHKNDEQIKNKAKSQDETINFDQKSRQDQDKKFPEGAHGAGDTNSSSISNINSMIGKDSSAQFKDPDHPAAYISHGDIIFYDECEEAKVYGKNNPKCEDMKKDQVSDATTNSNRIWSLPIAYVLDSSLEASAKTAINKAISEYSLKTCITFVQNSGATDRIRFKKGDKNNGCSSRVGRQGGEQTIYLSEGCEHKVVAVHEIMHAIGFYHEHERADRDNFVTINFNNIEAGKSHNFDKVTSEYTYYDQSYDYRSVMHYKRDFFGIKYQVKEGWWLDERTVTKRRETITPKINTDLGQCNDCGLSQKDALQLNARHCNVQRTTISPSVLLSQIKRMMVIYNGQSNDDFRHTLLNYLKAIYTTYYFTVSSYNAVTGGSTHYFRGYCQYVWRYYGRNVLVCYSRKSATFPSSTKQEEIKNAVLNEIKDKGCDAGTYVEKAWTKATSYGFGITMVHIVRHGNGLRTTWIGKTKFENYRCKRDCNWLNQCTDHKSSLVLMFGQP